jgi:SAM-dependent methyltransferase
MPSPWLAVTAADYEEHMGCGGADQLGALAGIFGQIYRSLRPRRLLVPGCGPGTGLEHVDPAVTRRTVGIDVNIQHVAVARQRFRGLGSALELYCADALRARLQPAADFDLVHVALLFEHVAPEALAREVAGWLAPGGTCAVVLDGPGAGAAAWARSEAMRRVASERRSVSPGELADLLAAHGLRRAGSWQVPLPARARLLVGLFRAPGPAPRAAAGPLPATGDDDRPEEGALEDGPVAAGVGAK